MNPSVESFSLVNFVEHLIKYKFLIIINLIIFFFITILSVQFINKYRTNFLYKVEISASELFDYKIGNNYTEISEDLLINKQTILFDTVYFFKNTNNLEQFFDTYLDESGESLSINDRTILFELYSSNINVVFNPDENNYILSLNINKSTEDQLSIDSTHLLDTYINYCIDKTLQNTVNAVSARLLYLEKTYESNLKFENERIDQLKESYSKLTQKLVDDNKLKIENDKRLLEYNLKVSREKEFAVRKVMENKLKSNIKIAKRLGYAKPLTSEAINSAIYGDAAQNTLSQTGNIQSLGFFNDELINRFPIYVFGYELLEEELKYLLQTNIDDSLSVKKHIIELDNLSATDHIAFVESVDNITDDVNSEINTSIQYLASLKYEFNREYDLTKRLLKNLKSEISASNRISWINYNKKSLIKETINLNILKYLVLSIFISILFSILIIYYRLEKTGNDSN